MGNSRFIVDPNTSVHDFLRPMYSNKLAANNIRTLSALIKLQESDLAALIGKKGTNEAKEALMGNHGILLGSYDVPVRQEAAPFDLSKDTLENGALISFDHPVKAANFIFICRRLLSKYGIEQIAEGQYDVTTHSEGFISHTKPQYEVFLTDRAVQVLSGLSNDDVGELRKAVSNNTFIGYGGGGLVRRLWTLRS